MKSFSQKGFTKNFLALMEKVGDKCCDNNIFNIFTEDSSSIDFEGSGTEINPLTAFAKISANVGNNLSIQPDGLYSTGGGGGVTDADNGLHLNGSITYLGGTLLENTLVDTATFQLQFNVLGAPDMLLSRQGTKNFVQAADSLAIANSTYTTNARTKLQIAQPFYYNSILSIFDTTGVMNGGNPDGDRPAVGVDIRTTVSPGLASTFFLPAAGYMTATIRPQGNWSISNGTSQAGNAFQTNLLIFPAPAVASSTINLLGGGILAAQYAAVTYANNGSTPTINITNGAVACYVSDYQQSSGVNGNVDNITDYYAGNSSVVSGGQTATRRIGFYVQPIAGNIVNKWAFFAESNPSWFGGDITVKGVVKEGIVANRQNGDYILALDDSGKLVEMNVGIPNTLTVPANGTIPFPVNTQIMISQYGAGQTTVVADGGVTIRSAGGALNLNQQYSGASLVKIATDEWYLFGDITV